MSNPYDSEYYFEVWEFMLPNGPERRVGGESARTPNQQFALDLANEYNRAEIENAKYERRAVNREFIVYIVTISRDLL